MSGHSKWAKLKHGKDDRDRQKGNLFGKLTRAITMAVIQNGGIPDPEKNAALRIAIDKARQENMPKENIQRAIERAVGPDKQNLKEVVYEAFGPYGAAFLIVATTDNPNRTHSEVKLLLDRSNGKLAGQGAVSYLFQDKTPLFPMTLDQEKMVVINGIVEQLENLDDVDDVYTNITL